MSNQDRICNLFYNKHKKQREIADIVGTSQQYVSKVIKEDHRYKQEKEQRQALHAKQRHAKQAQYNKSKKEQEIREYEYLKYLQMCNSVEMSKRYLTNSEQLSKLEKAIREKNVYRLS